MTDDLRDALRYGMRLTAGRLEQDDLEQEVHIALMQGGHDLATIDRPLLFTIVKRTAIDLVRKAHMNYERAVAYQETPPDTPSMGAAIMRTRPTQGHGPGDSFDQHEITEALVGHLLAITEGLPDSLREVVRLHCDGLNGNEIAERLGVKPHNARQALERARKTLGRYAGDVEVYRRFMHPEAKTSQKQPQASPELLERLQGYITL